MAGQAVGGTPTPAINQAPIVGNPTQGIRNTMMVNPGGGLQPVPFQAMNPIGAVAKAVPFGQTAPSNINTLAAEGIKGAIGGSAAEMGYAPLGVTAGQLGATNLAPYMNPYTTDVIDASQADVLRGANIGLDQLGAQAQQAKAFGGSRHGIAMSEMGRGVGEIMGQQAAGLRQANYAQAQQAAQQDISGRLQADLANQGVDLSGAQHRLGAASQLGQLSNLGFGMGQTVNQNLQTQGAMQQALQQAVMDAAKQKYGEYTGHPAQGLQYLQNALGTGVYGTPNTVTSTKTPGLFDYLTLGASMKAGQPMGSYS